jgi:hypothetical protein
MLPAAVYADRSVAAQPVDEMRDRAQACIRMPRCNIPQLGKSQ